LSSSGWSESARRESCGSVEGTVAFVADDRSADDARSAEDGRFAEGRRFAAGGLFSGDAFFAENVCAPLLALAGLLIRPPSRWRLVQGNSTGLRPALRREPGEAVERPPARAPARKSIVGVSDRLPSARGRCATIETMRVLVVDDDRAVRDALRRVLTLDGYDVQSAEDGGEAIEVVAQAVPDAVVLDVGMPGIDGLEVCERLRLLGNRVPILMLTARVEISDRVAGLDAGADDYLIKPFDVNELKARLRALLRRSGPESEPDELSFAEVKLDRALHGASVGEQFAELTRTEYQLLELFMRNPRQVLPHSVIYDRVWGYDFGPTSNALRVYVGYLRRKLQELGARDLLHTVRGVGYVMREP
jgi:two-component system response regulator MprA